MNRLADVLTLILAAVFVTWVLTYRYYAERACAKVCEPDSIESYGPPCTCSEPEEP